MPPLSIPTCTTPVPISASLIRYPSIALSPSSYPICIFFCAELPRARHTAFIDSVFSLLYFTGTCTRIYTAYTYPSIYLSTYLPTIYYAHTYTYINI